MKKLFLVLLVLALPGIVMGAEIAIKHNGDWLEITHTTSGEEDTAGQYYQYQEMDNLCSDQGLSAGCSQAEYETECVKVDTSDCETFYARTAEGGKLWFMDKLIKFNLTGMVVGRENDIGTRGRDYWISLSLAEKEAQCVAWGKAADCSEL